MARAVEIAAKVNYENWGGKWEAATEDRKSQSRIEVMKIFKALEDAGFSITRNHQEGHSE